MPASQYGELDTTRRELFRALQSIASAAGNPLLRELGGWESDVQSLPALLRAYRKALRPFWKTIVEQNWNVPFSCLGEKGPARTGNCGHGVLDAFAETVIQLFTPAADDGNGGLKITDANRFEIRTIWLPRLRRDAAEWAKLQEKLDTEELGLVMNPVGPPDAGHGATATQPARQTAPPAGACLVTLKEFADLIGLSKGTLENRGCEHPLPAPEIKSKGRAPARYTLNSLYDWLEIAHPPLYEVMKSRSFPSL